MEAVIGPTRPCRVDFARRTKVADPGLKDASIPNI